MTIAEPDVTLHLDLEGVIRDANLSKAFAGEEVRTWVGRPWVETVADVGGAKVRRMLEDAREQGVSAFSQVNQRFSSGLELPMEFTTVMLGGDAGLVAVGKNLLAVAELQSRLISAQQAMERDYWKLREVETRYRLLFDASNEAVLLLRANDLQVVEANPVAVAVLGMSPVGRALLPELLPRERDALQGMLARVRELGKAPGIMVHLGPREEPWLIRASLMTSEPGGLFLLHLSSVGASPGAVGRNDPFLLEDLLGRIPDGLVIIDRDTVVMRANRAFLDLVEVGSEASVTGEPLGRWLSRPGADAAVLLSTVQRHGVVRLFSTSIQGALGTETEVELSATGDSETSPRHYGVLIRSVGQRMGRNGLGHQGFLLSHGGVDRQVGRTPLRELVQQVTGSVERDYIEATLELTKGNRTAAAELLGLSRQSLYAKLNRYRLERGVKTPVDPADASD